MEEGMERYIPSPEEIRKAEEIMTPEQKISSEIRNRFKFQERDPFDDFMEHIDQDAERRSPTPEEKKQMDANLVKLGEIFRDSEVNWHIDGALNISLLKGEYIGIHKDVDISIEQSELEKTDGQLERNGYGLFLSYPKDSKEPKGKKIMERVSFQEFTDDQSGHLMIAAIDEQGKIKEGDSLNFIDVHLVKRNEKGNPTGWSGAELPLKWFEAQPIQFQGQEVHLSHPAKVAYFKIHSERNYDQTDLKALAETGSLSIEDINEIQQTFEQEKNTRRTEIENLLTRVAEKITPLMSSEEIFGIFSEEPKITKSKMDKIREPLKVLSQKIEKSDKSNEEITRLAFETFNLEASEDILQKKINELKTWIEDGVKLKELRDSLGLEK
jgi:hypothetical protein